MEWAKDFPFLYKVYTVYSKKYIFAIILPPKKGTNTFTPHNVYMCIFHPLMGIIIFLHTNTHPSSSHPFSFIFFLLGLWQSFMCKSKRFFHDACWMFAINFISMLQCMRLHINIYMFGTLYYGWCILIFF